ncbi:MAG: peptidoglycan DD-metalloendopeptidase family protein [Saprospiraceae bacterium]|nr:peptidoglycan DD-metalloendopeptidase family protein [Saprospiraceae bacterium]
MSYTKPAPKPAPILKTSIWVLAAIVFGVGFSYFFKQINAQSSLTGAIPEIELGEFPIVEPTVKYGFALDTFVTIEKIIQPNEFLGDILGQFHIDYASVDQLAQNSKEVFDIRQLRSGKPYTILTKDTSARADYFIYEPSVYEYYVFDLKDKLNVRHVERTIDTQIHTAGGRIQSSLWQTMVDNGLSIELTAKMEDALQWSIDFHHLQKGDEFKVVYEQHFIEGQEVGAGKVHAAFYKNFDNEYYAIWYDGSEEFEGYYDQDGRPMNKGFLKAPVKYSRISSGYNLNRYHPILKRTRPHLGTDYAAPYGTPILAVGDGVVTAASYTNGNGNFVKIRHDKTYETQYLHMQKFATGISSGVHVKQGQVIGYVGSTGLATGPHVCFRFWKNGKQVNHLKLDFPPPAPLPEELLPEFYKIRDSYLATLSGYVIPEPIAATPLTEPSEEGEERRSL